MRQLLKRFDGYECKEPEPGKFTLAFADFHAAVAFAVTAQKELLNLDCPPEVPPQHKIALSRHRDHTRVIRHGPYPDNDFATAKIRQRQRAGGALMRHASSYPREPRQWAASAAMRRRQSSAHRSKRL